MHGFDGVVVHRVQEQVPVDDPALDVFLEEPADRYLRLQDERGFDDVLLQQGGTRVEKPDLDVGPFKEAVRPPAEDQGSG